MPEMIDLVGERFGRLVVTRFAERRYDDKGRSSLWWECKCDCGRTIVARAASLRKVKLHPGGGGYGKTQSCGCLMREKLSERNLRFRYQITKNERMSQIKGEVGCSASTAAILSKRVRKPRIDPPEREELINILKKSTSVRGAAARAGISMPTMGRWLRERNIPEALEYINREP